MTKTELPLEVKISSTTLPEVPFTIRQQVLTTIAHFIEIGRRLFPGIDLPMPTCSFDIRGRVAGTANSQKWHIRINPILLVENLADFLKSTVPHEVAHLVARRAFTHRITSHGKEWQSVMIKFGVPPTRCHSYDTTNASTAKELFLFECSCKTFNISNRRVRKAAMGAYKCLSCKSTLKFSGKVIRNGVWHSEQLPSKYLPKTRNVAPSNSNTPEPVKTQRIDAPSEKQLSYAQSIARRKGLTIPSSILQSKSALSRWISDNL